MKPSRDYHKPVAVSPSGRPEHLPPDDHWTNHWTVGECLTYFHSVPMALKLFDQRAKVRGIWNMLTLGMQIALDHEFTFYDLTSGRV